MSDRDRHRRYRERKRAEKYGPNAPDQRGRHGNHARGSRHPRWNNGCALSSHGYVRFKVGKSHPLADPNGYAYAHHLVWVAAGNAMLSKGDVLHHRSGDKADNRIENLELISNGEHVRLHGAIRRGERT